MYVWFILYELPGYKIESEVLGRDRMMENIYDKNNVQVAQPLYNIKEVAKLETLNNKAITVVRSIAAVGKAALWKNPVLDKPPAASTAPLKKLDGQLLLTAA